LSRMSLLLTAFLLTLLPSVLFIALVHEDWSKATVAISFLALVPVAIAAVPFLFHPGSKGRVCAAYGATLLLFGCVTRMGFAVFLFYLPATALMAIAAVRMAIKTPAHMANQLDNPNSAAPNTFPPARS